MGSKIVFLLAFLIGNATAQIYRVCATSASSQNCQRIGIDDSQVTCQAVETRLDCALKIARNEADIGYFTEEETLLLSQVQPDSHRVIATVRDVSKLDPYAFESVAIVRSNHTNGLEGLRGGAYCHPGLDETELKWSPRVLKTLEELAARTNRCPDTETAGKTAEELEVDTISKFFSSACRPGTWSANASVDADLKSRYPSLCSLCGPNANCSRYTIDMGINIAGVRNENRHIQALECLRQSNASAGVAYVAWQHAKEYFMIRNPQDAASFALMCSNGTVVPLTTDTLNSAVSPCAFVRQPWGAIVVSTANAAVLRTNLATWWPGGTNPSDNSWRTTLFRVLDLGNNARVEIQPAPISVLNYTNPIRAIGSVDSTASCLPTRRWCTISTAEQTKCAWVRAAAFTLGLQPTISCQQRANVIECLSEIKENKVDFISSPSNYGYLARQHYQLTPVKLVQNHQENRARIAAFVKVSAAANDNITRFENLRGRKACFPEFGGLAYMSFVRAGQERGVLPSTECDYARVVGEFFSGACAPGAVNASHALSESTFDATTLCSACRPTVGNLSESICTWDYTNKYFGNNGSLSCLSDSSNDVAFLNMRNISSQLRSLGLQANQFRALCRNNTLAANPGIDIDNGCLLAYVVDAEVVTRRNDPLFNALNALLDTLESYFGYSSPASRLINLSLFDPFDGVSDTLFKDSTIGLTEPVNNAKHEAAGNYIELFKHLQACTGAAPQVPGLATRSFYSITTLVVTALLTRFVMN